MKTGMICTTFGDFVTKEYDFNMFRLVYTEALFPEQVVSFTSHYCGLVFTKIKDVKGMYTLSGYDEEINDREKMQ